MARGYLKDEEKTNKVFIDGSRFSWAVPGETRFYATGDIVRQNADGSIIFIGRRDLQLKLNGVRIESGDVEYALEQCEDIAAAFVEKVSSKDTGSESLIAFITMTTADLQAGHEEILDPTSEVRRVIRKVCERAAESLPANLVPQIYIPLGEVLLTESGKVDRSGLHRIFEQCSGAQIASYRSNLGQLPTKSTMQRILQGLWAQVSSLNPEQIFLDSNFVSLGGESLAAIKLATMCRDVGLQLTIADILRKPCLEDLASHAELSRGPSSDSSHVSVGSALNLNDGSSSL